MLIKRLKGEYIPFGPWSLGHYGFALNVASLIFLTITVFFSFFPSELPVVADNMNYSIVVFAGEFIAGLAWYVIRGRKHYNGPIIEPGIMPMSGGDFAAGLSELS